MSSPSSPLLAQKRVRPAPMMPLDDDGYLDRLVDDIVRRSAAQPAAPTTAGARVVARLEQLKRKLAHRRAQKLE